MNTNKDDKELSDETKAIIISFMRESYSKHGWKKLEELLYPSGKNKKPTSLVAKLQKDGITAKIDGWMGNGNNPTITITTAITFDVGDPKLYDKLNRFFKDGRKIHK